MIFAMFNVNKVINTVNLKDIARLAGVSHTTVSRVINKADGVSPEIRERIQNIINQYGFTLNYNAKALISGKTNVIGLFPANFCPRSWWASCPS